MIALAILGGIFLLLFLCAISSISASLRYKTNGGLTVKVGFGIFSLTLYPNLSAKINETKDPKKKRKLIDKLEKKRQKKEDKAARKALKKAQKKKEAPKPEVKEPPKKKKNSLKRDIRFLARTAILLLNKFGERTTIKLKRFLITVASSDAANTAYLYGAVSAGTAYLIAIIENRTKHPTDLKHVVIDADFTKEKTEADIHVVISIRLYSIFSLAFIALWQLVTRKKPADKDTDKKREKKKETEQKNV